VEIAIWGWDLVRGRGLIVPSCFVGRAVSEWSPTAGAILRGQVTDTRSSLSRVVPRECGKAHEVDEGVWERKEGRDIIPSVREIARYLKDTHSPTFCPFCELAYDRL